MSSGDIFEVRMNPNALNGSGRMWLYYIEVQMR